MYLSDPSRVDDIFPEHAKFPRSLLDSSCSWKEEGVGKEIYKMMDTTRPLTPKKYSREDEDGILERLEGPAKERMMMREAVEEYEEQEVVTLSATAAARELLYEEEEDVVEEERMTVHVPLSNDKEIEKMVLEKEKMWLLNKYVSDGLLEEQNVVKSMLSIPE